MNGDNIEDYDNTGYDFDMLNYSSILMLTNAKLSEYTGDFRANLFLDVQMQQLLTKEIHLQFVGDTAKTNDTVPVTISINIPIPFFHTRKIVKHVNGLTGKGANAKKANNLMKEFHIKTIASNIVQSKKYCFPRICNGYC